MFNENTDKIAIVVDEKRAEGFSEALAGLEPSIESSFKNPDGAYIGVYLSYDWHDDDPIVQAVDAFLNELALGDFGFIRLGSDYGDYEEIGSPFEFGLTVTRRIEIPWEGSCPKLKTNRVSGNIPTQRVVRVFSGYKEIIDHVFVLEDYQIKSCGEWWENTKVVMLTKIPEGVTLENGVIKQITIGRKRFEGLMGVITRGRWFILLKAEDYPEVIAQDETLEFMEASGILNCTGDHCKVPQEVRHER